MSAPRPIPCARAARWIYPALDGALASRELAAFEAHLALCPACHDLHAREVAFRARQARAAAARPPAPASLHARVEEALPPGEARAAGPATSPRRPRSRLWTVGLAAAAAAGVAVLLGEPLVRERSSTPALVRSVAAQQAALAEGRLPLEVRSEVSGEVAGWLRPRLGFPVELPATAGPGVAVVGARLTELAAAEAAAVVYRVGGRPVTLFTFPADTLRASTEGARTVEVGEGGHRFHLYRLGDLTVTLWARGEVGYALAAPAGVAASHGCAVCHVGDEGGRLERALGAVVERP